MITQIAATVASIALAAVSCGGPAPGSKTPPGDDGRLMFHSFGRVAYGKHLKAHDMPTHGAACRWRIEVEPITGLKPGQEPRVVAKGDGGNAKVYLPDKPDNVVTYLVTKGCGTWSE